MISVEADCAVKLPTELEVPEESRSTQQRLRELESQQHQHGRRASVQNNPPAWGIDRIDSRTGTDSEYRYGDFDGEGVRIYILDTGVRLTHQEFAGRIDTGCARRSAATSSSSHPASSTPPLAPKTGPHTPFPLPRAQHLHLVRLTAHAPVCSYSPGFVNNGASDYTNDADDCNGHGTHCAGTAVGTRAGVAKAATVVPVQVLGCSGSGWTSDIIEGIEWAMEGARATLRPRLLHAPAKRLCSRRPYASCQHTRHPVAQHRSIRHTLSLSMLTHVQTTRRTARAPSSLCHLAAAARRPPSTRRARRRTTTASWSSRPPATTASTTAAVLPLLNRRRLSSVPPTITTTSGTTTASASTSSRLASRSTPPVRRAPRNAMLLEATPTSTVPPLAPPPLSPSTFPPHQRSSHISAYARHAHAYTPSTPSSPPSHAAWDTDYNSDTSYASLSGTSMATPHVSGVAATLLSANGDLDADEIAEAITCLATTDTISGTPSDTTEKLVRHTSAAL